MEKIKDELKDNRQAQKKKRSHGRKGNKPSLGISEILTRQSGKKSDCWGKGKG